MKKLSASLLALLIAGLSAAAADAKNVVGARVNPNPEAVKAYWTPERMKNAKPACNDL